MKKNRIQKIEEEEDNVSSGLPENSSGEIEPTSSNEKPSDSE